MMSGMFALPLTVLLLGMDSDSVIPTLAHAAQRAAGPALPTCKYPRMAQPWWRFCAGNRRRRNSPANRRATRVCWKCAAGKPGRKRPANG